MSTVQYHLTVTDSKGNVFMEIMHINPVHLVQDLPEIRKKAEDWRMERDAADLFRIQQAQIKNHEQN